jgi:2-keto-3-deoxy-galactonokinase
MMYASWDRRTAIRRWLPQNWGAVASSPGGRSGIAPARVESAAAVLRRVVDDSVTSGADRAVTDGVSTAQSGATISAHRNPASSRAMAAAATERTFLWAAS